MIITEMSSAARAVTVRKRYGDLTKLRACLTTRLREARLPTDLSVPLIQPPTHLPACLPACLLLLRGVRVGFGLVRLPVPLSHFRADGDGRAIGDGGSYDDAGLSS